MSYQSISVKEAVERVNASHNGWFLPAVQRPYVWASRHENELYICKLFDSIIRGYPIGGIILWNTEDEIPYREFLRDYKVGDMAAFADKGLWGRSDKNLVYDGQQRMQTLYSCLKYTLNEKVLVYNLLFDLHDSLEDPNETGFSFVEKHASIPVHWIRMNELFAKQADDKTKYRRELIKRCSDLHDADVETMENNIDRLWDVFVRTDTKSIAFFMIQGQDEDRVNEIFQRLNTGGIQLSQSDLLLSRIKESFFDFEEQLQLASKDIYTRTGSGYVFNSYSILQVMYLILKGTTRVDPKKVRNDEIERFNQVWEDLKQPLFEFFNDFIWGQFKINNASIVPKKLALLPLIVYFYEIYKHGHKFKYLKPENTQKIMQFFILSQINDWNLQSIVDRFTRIIKDSISSSQLEFPLDEIRSWIIQSKRRNADLYEVNVKDFLWFSLKIVTPNRIYQFDQDLKGRFNPEIDHIFPVKLESQTEDYYKSVDVLWNMQPVKGEINNLKRRKHPSSFFANEGAKYVHSDYDHLPSTNPDDDIYKRPLDFIEERRLLILKFIKQRYGLDVKN